MKSLLDHGAMRLFFVAGTNFLHVANLVKTYLALSNENKTNDDYFKSSLVIVAGLASKILT